jgi:hypothetical protein
MTKLHLHISVDNLSESIRFYSTLFNKDPVKIKTDYAKWDIEEPSLILGISDRSAKKGLDHLGIHASSKEELSEITKRLEQADMSLYNKGETVCCYARSEKAWVKDPSDIPWETYQNMEDAELFNKQDNREKVVKNSNAGSCC